MEAPRAGGEGCDEIDPGAIPVGTPEVDAPSATRLSVIFPNPFSGETSVHFDAARPMIVRVSVFDVAGRQIRLLEDRLVPAGRHASSGMAGTLPGVLRRLGSTSSDCRAMAWTRPGR